MSKRPTNESRRYAHTCPICEQPMIAVGFCHLECPSGHYQEVCSDLFLPTAAAPDQTISDRHSEIPKDNKRSS